MRNAVLILICLALAPFCRARTITVNDDGPGDFNNIQAAIDDANDGDTVEIQPGTYTGPGNRDIDFLGKAITVRSTDPNDPNIVATTIIDCNGTESHPHRGFNFVSGEGPDSVLAGLTITHGYGHEQNVGGSVRSAGGAVYSLASSPTITDCALIDNSTDIYYSLGGAICIDIGNPTITNCIITGNVASYGSALYCLNDNTTAANCLIVGNSGHDEYRDRYGGGFFLRNSNARILNCTISDNSSDYGGAIACIGTGKPVVSNCILWGNAAFKEGHELALYSFSGSLTTSYSNVGGGLEEVFIRDDVNGLLIWRADNIDTDPCFVERGHWQTDDTWAAGDYHLWAYSDCIDRGDPGYIPLPGETDIDGATRVISGRIDIGADEVDYSNPTLVTSREEIEFNATLGQGNGLTQLLYIRNGGSGALNWQITEDCPWLQVTPTEGLSPGGNERTDITIDITGLEWGAHTCELMITSPEIPQDSRRIPVMLHITNGDEEHHVPAEYKSIQMAIDAASGGDVVIISPGVYTGPGNRDLDFVGKAITVRGIDPNDPTVVDATVIDCRASVQDPHRGFNFRSGEGPDSVLAGLTITNGCGPYESLAPTSESTVMRGGAIYCEQSSPTVINCVIIGNSAASGGGVYARDGSHATFLGCTIARNYLAGGAWERSTGGMLIGASNPSLINCLFIENAGTALHNGTSNPTVTGCTFSENHGWAIYNTHSNPIIVDCTFTRNTRSAIENRYSDPTIRGCHFLDNGGPADFGGGAIASEFGGVPTVTYCTFTGNSARYGGAIYGSYTYTIISHCTFAGNTAEKGGAVRGRCDIGNCLFVDNSATSFGGAVSLYESIVANCTLYGNSAPEAAAVGSGEGVIVRNCILWDGGNEVPSPPLNMPDVRYSNVQGGCPGIGNFDADPLFVDPAGGDFHLLPISPCINTGDPCYVPVAGQVDMDGQSRVMNERIDIGIYEIDCNDPMLAASPRQIHFVIPVSGLNPRSQTIIIRNVGTGTIDWSLAHDCDWLSLSPTGGSVTNEKDEVTATVDIALLAPGYHTCPITISDRDAFNSPQVVVVHLSIGYTVKVPDDFRSIQDAIDNAVEGSIVVVADGTYTGPGNRDIDLKGKQFVVRSENGPQRCIIDCNAADGDEHRGFYFHGGENADTVIDGFTITDAYTSEGGAILSYSSSPTIINCIITGNTARYSSGGGVHLEDGSPTIHNCKISFNSASTGGGIHCSGGGLRITNSIITGNRVDYAYGGGIECNYCRLTMANCTVCGNFAIGGRGSYPGILCRGQDIVITSSIFWDNMFGPQVYGPDFEAITHNVIEDLPYYDTGNNFSFDPCFATPGHWDPNGTPYPYDSFWVDGDYHLKSEAGRWDLNNGSWAQDDVTSPCIDAGNPKDPIGHEPFPKWSLRNNLNILLMVLSL